MDVPYYTTTSLVPGSAVAGSCWVSAEDAIKNDLVQHSLSDDVCGVACQRLENKQNNKLLLLEDV